jgi:hypothetical protein
MPFQKQPPLAVLLNGTGGGCQAVPGKPILPVIQAQKGLKIGQRDKGMQRGARSPASVVHVPKVNPPLHPTNGTNLQNEEKLRLIIFAVLRKNIVS